MGKRVSNKRGKRVGARSGRVRLGYWRQHRIGNVERAMEEHRKKTILGKPMDEQAVIAFKALSRALEKLMPKRTERRGIR